MPRRNIGPKPRNPKSRPYFPSEGYWKVRIGHRTVKICSWDIKNLNEIDRRYEEKKKHYEQVDARTSREQLTDLEVDSLLVEDLIELYLVARAKNVDHPNPNLRLAPNTFANYKRSLQWVLALKIPQQGPLRKIKATDLGPAVFSAISHAAAEHYGTRQWEHVIITTRMMVKWAYENEYLPSMPRYGTEFKPPSVKVKRLDRKSKIKKLLSKEQIRAMLSVADSRWRALIYLGINCAYLQVDCSELMIDQGQLHLGDEPYIDFDRVKTMERRRCTLWPETKAALLEEISSRTQGRVFLTSKGFPLVHTKKKIAEDGLVLGVTNCDWTVKAFRNLGVRAGIRPAERKNDPMKGIGFSALRSTFHTVAMQTPNLTVANKSAIQWIMGHKIGGQASLDDVYMQEIDLSTLRQVTDHVRDWLFK